MENLNLFQDPSWHSEFPLFREVLLEDSWWPQILKAFPDIDCLKELRKCHAYWSAAAKRNRNYKRCIQNWIRKEADHQDRYGKPRYTPQEETARREARRSKQQDHNRDHDQRIQRGMTWAEFRKRTDGGS